jgi:hypothetical protein
MTRNPSVHVLPAIALTLGALVAVPAVAPAQVATPKEIVYPPLPAFQVPKATRFVLPNGMVVMVIEDHELPLVNVSARVRTGSLLEPGEKAGLAGLFGTVQRSGGTTTRKPDALDEFLESRAASIETGMGADSGSASMSALKADVPAVLEAFADVLRNPAFDPDRLKVAVTAVNAGIARQNDNPQGITQREFTKAVQGADTPFGRTTTYAPGTRSTTTRTGSSSASSATSPSRRRARSSPRRSATGPRGLPWPTPGRRRARRRTRACSRRSSPTRRSPSSPSVTRASCCAPAPTTSRSS